MILGKIEAALTALVNDAADVAKVAQIFNEIKDDNGFTAEQIYLQTFQLIIKLPPKKDVQAKTLIEALWPKIKAKKYQTLDAEDNNFLLRAVGNGLVESATFLLQQGCDFIQRNKTGCRALDLAERDVINATGLIRLLETIESGHLSPADVDVFINTVSRVREDKEHKSTSSNVTSSSNSISLDANVKQLLQTTLIDPKIVCELLQPHQIPAGQTREQYLVVLIKAFNAVPKRNAMREAKGRLEAAQDMVKMLRPVTAGLMEVNPVAQTTSVLRASDAKNEMKTTVAVQQSTTPKTTDTKTDAASTGDATRDRVLTFWTPARIAADLNRVTTDFNALLNLLNPNPEIWKNISDSEKIWTAVASHMTTFIADTKTEATLTNIAKLLQRLCCLNPTELANSAACLGAISSCMRDPDLSMKILSQGSVDPIKLFVILAFGSKVFPANDDLKKALLNVWKVVQQKFDADALNKLQTDYLVNIVIALATGQKVFPGNRELQLRFKELQTSLAYIPNIFLDLLTPSFEILTSEDGEFFWDQVEQWANVTTGHNDEKNEEARLAIGLRLLERLCNFSSDVLGFRKPALQAISKTFLDHALCPKIITSNKIDKAKLLVALTKGIERFPDEEIFRKAHHWLGIAQEFETAMTAKNSNKTEPNTTGAAPKATEAPVVVLKKIRTPEFAQDPKNPKFKFQRALLQVCTDLLAGKREVQRHQAVVQDSKSEATIDADHVLEHFKYIFLKDETPVKTKTEAAIHILEFYQRKGKAHIGALFYWLVRILSQLPEIDSEPRVRVALELDVEHPTNEDDTHEYQVNERQVLMSNFRYTLKDLKSNLAELNIQREVSPFVYDSCLIYLFAKGLKQDRKFPPHTHIGLAPAKRAEIGRTIFLGMEAELKSEYSKIAQITSKQMPPPTRAPAKSVTNKPATNTATNNAAAAALQTAGKTPPVVSASTRLAQAQPDPLKVVSADTSATTPAVDVTTKPRTDATNVLRV